MLLEFWAWTYCGADITCMLLAPSRSTDAGSILERHSQQSLDSGEAHPSIPSSRSLFLSRHHPLLGTLYESFVRPNVPRNTRLPTGIAMMDCTELLRYIYSSRRVLIGNHFNSSIGLLKGLTEKTFVVADYRCSVIHLFTMLADEFVV